MAEGESRERKRILEFMQELTDSSDGDFSGSDSENDGDYVCSSNSSISSESSSEMESEMLSSNDEFSTSILSVSSSMLHSESQTTAGTSRGFLQSPPKSARGRWRNKVGRVRENNKKKRNLGHVYKKSNGSIEPARKLGPPCLCKKKCRSLLNGKEVSIFNDFWNLGSYDVQNAVLFGRIKVHKKHRSYPKKTKSNKISRRTNTIRYYVSVDSKDIQVCKQEFLSLHGFKNDERVRVIVDQAVAGESVPQKDKRGKHQNRKNAVPPHVVQSIRDHINLIPKYQSHYSRKSNPGKVYLDSNISIASLYTDYYIPWCAEKDLRPASQDKYRRIFCTEYNIGFKLPKSDTCKTCDRLNVQIEAAKETDGSSAHLKNELDLHQRRAENIQEAMKKDIHDVLAENDNKKIIISFDLQQALPTPLLTVGPAFYLRKIWTYNFGIHHYTSISDNGCMFMWTEDVAKRGSEEIASCLLKFFNNYLGSHTDQLIAHSDNCSGQNKNWVIMSLWLQLIREKRFKTIEHRFLVSGHTHLPSDRDFALIEKQKARVKQVYCPDHWKDVILKSKRNNQFKVDFLTQNDFKNFSTVLATVNTKKQHVEEKCEGNSIPLNFSKIRVFRFEAEHPNTIFIKHVFNEEFKTCKIIKRGQTGYHNNLLGQLPKKYNSKLALSVKKINDIRQLLPYIPPIYKNYYDGILSEMQPDQNDEEVEILEENFESD